MESIQQNSTLVYNKKAVRKLAIEGNFLKLRKRIYKKQSHP